MLAFLQNGIFLLIIFTALFGCADSRVETKEKTGNTENDALLNRALVNGYYAQLTEDIGISAYNSKIYLLTGVKKGFSEDKFLLHFIKPDNSFLNKDFEKDEYTIDARLFNKFKKLSVIQLPKVSAEFSKIRIGQYIRLEDLTTKNIWVNQISVKDIETKASHYKNQFEDLLNKNLINEAFKLSLEFDVFFKNAQGFGILYGDDFIYIISEKSFDTDEKFMLHFIDEENNFVNKSFDLNRQHFEKQLEATYANLVVTRIPLPGEPFVKIRIGQFNSSGNIWVQEFSPEEILKNPLLRYNNEFENYEP